MLRSRWFRLLLLLLSGLAILTGGGLMDGAARTRFAPAASFPVAAAPPAADTGDPGAPAGAGCWTVVPTGYNPDGAALYGVAALADNDVWAVGTQNGHGDHAQTMHWNGQQWTAGPALSARNPSALYGVAAAAPNNVWAVGTVPDNGNPFVLQPLIAHWDGSGWTVQPLAPFGSPTVLYGVGIRAPDDIWAVGDIILHWDGLAWAVVPRPPGGALRAVTAPAADNAWAVGDGGLILHWDGTAWSSWPSPPGTGDLTGIVGVAANDIWAVGSYPAGGVDQTLTLHWDGTAWAVVASPSPPSTSHLYRVAAGAPNDVWAVGEYYGLSDYQTLVFHWDGAAWTRVASPNVGWDDNALHGVAVLSPGAAWAVGTRGYDGNGAQEGPLALHYTVPCVPSPPPVCAADWQVVASPSLDDQGNSLQAVAAVDAADIWAVGSTVGNNGHPLLGLIEHWDGAAWTIMPGANLGPREHAFYGIAARTAADVWAVGARVDSNGANQTLVEHWDGAAWSSVPISGTGILYGVTALAANDAWAVGESGAYHWDGAAWSPVATLTGLHAVAGTATDDVWAAGVGGTYHWDGQAWASISGPYPGSFAGIVAIARNDVWAVGQDAVQTAVAQHWDGTSWAADSSFLRGFTHPFGIAATASDDVWAVGVDTAPHYAQMWAAHWDGATWAPASVERPARAAGPLFGVVALASDNAWAVGEAWDDTIVQHYDGPCLTSSPTPSPTTTATPSATATATMPMAPSATRTPAPATPTPGPTGTATPPPNPSATPCTLTFTDVDQNHPFYPYIRCLACRGIVAGYADGTFRPGNAVTRGQLAKILAGAAFADAIPSTQQTFADVPYGAAFWRWTEQLAVHQAISGYACGGPGEPCDGQHRPYYRPGSPATRGQIAKITALAADLRDPVPSGQQTFADVPGSNPFRLWIEQLAGRGIVSGYSCGGPGEPCDPAQRPYFRWGADTTRGQMTKITANTFFPACPTPTER